MNQLEGKQLESAWRFQKAILAKVIPKDEYLLGIMTNLQEVGPNDLACRYYKWKSNTHLSLHYKEFAWEQYKGMKSMNPYLA